jgi:ArsR family transcriptional regulator
LRYNNNKMGVTKKDFFTDKQNTLANLFKALGHPARIAIIDYLLKKQECICGDIVDELPLAQPTISQHLKELKNAGLIKGTVSGTSVCYCIDDRTFSKIKEHFLLISKKLETQQQCC